TVSSGYNELKLEVLEAFVNWEKVTAGDMANALGRTHTSISWALLRYHRMGLLSRYTIHRNEKVYALTPRGLERLDWLMEQASDGDNENDGSDTEQGDDDSLKDYENLYKLQKEIRELEEKIERI
ncbi:unnamed protein product, partial [marine sediment metagenome]